MDREKQPCTDKVKIPRAIHGCRLKLVTRPGPMSALAAEVEAVEAEDM